MITRCRCDVITRCQDVVIQDVVITQSRNNKKGNYGTLRLKLWHFPIESASNADSGNVILWERERQTLVAFTAFSVF